MSAFQIAGYDKRTELLAVQHPLPIERVSDVQSLVHMTPNDDGFGCYPLDAAAANQIGHWLEWPLQVDLYDWFLEPADG